MTVDSAILAVVVAFLLPLRLLSLVVRLNSSGSAGDLRRSCTAFAIAAALLSAIFALPRDHVGRTGHCGVPVADAGEDGMGREVRLEIEQLKLQLNRLESFWENNSKASDGKSHGSEEDVELVKVMGLDIQSLIKEQENIKAILVKMHTEWDNNSKASDEKGHVSEEDGEVVKAMGLDIQALIKEQENIKELLWISESTVKSVTNEVRILSADSRKMNSDIDSAWSLANDTKKAVEALHSDVKKVQVITDESRKMSSSIHQVWSLAQDTGKKVEALYADIEKVQIVSDISRKMEANMHKMWSYAKQTEKGVEDLYSDVKKNVVQKGTGGWKKIVKAFGNDILLENGEIDRAQLGQIVFSDPVKRKLLNSLLAPHISFGIFWEILKLWMNGSTVIIVDIPLLFETKMDRWTDPVIVVWVDPKTQIERLMSRDGCSEEQAQNRINAQLALDWKKSEADIVIDNSGSVDDTKEHFQEVLKQVAGPLTWKERMMSRDGLVSIVLCSAAGVLLAQKNLL